MELFANFKIFIYLFFTAVLIGIIWFLGIKRKNRVIDNLFSKNNYKRLIDAGLAVRRRWKNIL